ncbi:hypothetical protein L1987_19134 [Smallanthus sonchifolius]|uniref:Uncharacterized protein n=1 Tax=Smallanthus sonchifolius TaxID=185202 RepID=A0ACB9J3U3_9ASTR|nr:hypothetical protein L1987_19134 [Smallanthus sonchifolius]
MLFHLLPPSLLPEQQGLHVQSMLLEMKILKKLAAEGEGSCREDTLRVLNDDDDEDPNEIQSGRGVGFRRCGRSERQRKASNVLEGIETQGDKIDCLIDLDDVFIDDWESEYENVEIEFEQDDESVKYATHEAFEFDTLYINQINDQAREENQDREEGEILGDGDKEKDDKDENVNVTAEAIEQTTWSYKKKAWFKTIPKSPPLPVK